MGDSTETQAVNEQFDKIWHDDLNAYKEKTQHDLEHFREYKDWTIEQLSQEFDKKDEHFSDLRKGRSEGLKKTRDFLKACVKPIEALSSVASSAISLTPFAPAATVFGAGIYLISESTHL